MKNSWKAFGLLTMLIFAFAACQPSPYKKHKPCNGKGGWYKNRNLDGRGGG
jgi:hypothetical protein